MQNARAAAVVAIVAIALTMTSCGDGTPTLAEYAEDVERAMAQMRVRIVATDEALNRPSSSLAEEEAIWRERVAAREEFLVALKTIDPPDEAAEIHAEAEQIVRRLADAEAAVGDQIGEYDELVQLEGLGTTPALGAFIDVNEEATTICLAAQGKFDETRDREALADVPWIPGELKEVVEVLFGCVPGDS
jgi:hypothetical protein